MTLYIASNAHPQNDMIPGSRLVRSYETPAASLLDPRHEDDIRNGVAVRIFAAPAGLNLLDLDKETAIDDMVMLDQVVPGFMDTIVHTLEEVKRKPGSEVAAAAIKAAEDFINSRYYNARPGSNHTPETNPETITKKIKYLGAATAARAFIMYAQEVGAEAMNDLPFRSDDFRSICAGVTVGGITMACEKIVTGQGQAIYAFPHDFLRAAAEQGQRLAVWLKQDGVDASIKQFVEAAEANREYVDRAVRAMHEGSHLSVLFASQVQHALESAAQAATLAQDLLDDDSVRAKINEDRMLREMVESWALAGMQPELTALMLNVTREPGNVARMVPSIEKMLDNSPTASARSSDPGLRDLEQRIADARRRLTGSDAVPARPSFADHLVETPFRPFRPSAVGRSGPMPKELKF